MRLSGKEREGTGTQGDPFTTTRWSVVLAAGDSQSPGSREALAILCAKYWPPLYAYVRHRGYPVEEAQDLTQEFFTRLLEKNPLGKVQRERGRFRAFLLASMKHFLADEWDKKQAQKRGGGTTPIPLDFVSAEGRCGPAPSHSLTPEKLYERRWALTVLEQVLAQLEQEYARSGKAAQFERLQHVLTGSRGQIPYRQLGNELGLSEGAVKVAVHRLRRRYRVLLKETIAETLAAKEDIEEELRFLKAALAG